MSLGDRLKQGIDPKTGLVSKSRYQGTLIGTNINQGDTFSDIADQRGMSQTGLEAMGNSVVRLGANILGEVMGAGANMASLWRDEREYNDTLWDIMKTAGDDLKESTNEDFEILTTSNDKGLQWSDAVNPKFWANTVDQFGPTIAMMAVSMGAAGVASKGLMAMMKTVNPTMAKNIATAERALAKGLDGTATGKKAIEKLNKYKQLSNTVSATAISRSIESGMEATQAYDQIKDTLIADGRSIEEAEALAAQGASDVYKSNWALAVLDLAQYDMLFGNPITRETLKKTKASKLTKGIGAYGSQMVSEGFEEGMQYSFTTEAEAEARGRETDISKDYFSNDEFWESVVQGALGGVVFQGLGDIGKKLLGNKEKVQKKQKDIEETVKDLNKAAGIVDPSEDDGGGEGGVSTLGYVIPGDETDPGKASFTGQEYEDGSIPLDQTDYDDALAKAKAKAKLEATGNSILEESDIPEEQALVKQAKERKKRVNNISSKSKIKSREVKELIETRANEAYDTYETGQQELANNETLKEDIDKGVLGDNSILNKHTQDELDLYYNELKKKDALEKGYNTIAEHYDKKIKEAEENGVKSPSKSLDSTEHKAKYTKAAKEFNDAQVKTSTASKKIAELAENPDAVIQEEINRAEAYKQRVREINEVFDARIIDELSKTGNLTKKQVKDLQDAYKELIEAEANDKFAPMVQELTYMTGIDNLATMIQAAKDKIAKDPSLSNAATVEVLEKTNASKETIEAAKKAETQEELKLLLDGNSTVQLLRDHDIDYKEYTDDREVAKEKYDNRKTARNAEGNIYYLPDNSLPDEDAHLHREWRDKYGESLTSAYVEFVSYADNGNRGPKQGQYLLVHYIESIEKGDVKLDSGYPNRIILGKVTSSRYKDSKSFLTDPTRISFIKSEVKAKGRVKVKTDASPGKLNTNKTFENPPSAGHIGITRQGTSGLEIKVSNVKYNSKGKLIYSNNVNDFILLPVEGDKAYPNQLFQVIQKNNRFVIMMLKRRKANEVDSVMTDLNDLLSDSESKGHGTAKVHKLLSFAADKTVSITYKDGNIRYNILQNGEFVEGMGNKTRLEILDYLGKQPVDLNFPNINNRNLVTQELVQKHLLHNTLNQEYPLIGTQFKIGTIIETQEKTSTTTTEASPSIFEAIFQRVSKLKYSERIEALIKEGIIASNITYNLGKRFPIILNINGTKIAFYRSSEGTGGKEKGSWTPMFGFGKSKGNPWLIKGSIESINASYNNSTIKEYQDLLNNTLNWDHSIDKGQLKDHPYFKGLTLASSKEAFNKELYGVEDLGIVNYESNVSEFIKSKLNSLSDSTQLNTKSTTTTEAPNKANKPVTKTSPTTGKSIRGRRSTNKGKGNKVSKETIKWFTDRFPNFPIEVLENLNEIGGTNAWGVFTKAMVAIREGAASSVVYHEAMHVMTELVLSPTQRKQVMDQGLIAYNKANPKNKITKKELEASILGNKKKSSKLFSKDNTKYANNLRKIANRRSLATQKDLNNSQLIKDKRVDKSQPNPLSANQADLNLTSIMLYGHNFESLSYIEYLEDNNIDFQTSEEMQLEVKTLAYRILNDLMFDIKDLMSLGNSITPELASALSTNENPVKDFYTSDIFDVADTKLFSKKSPIRQSQDTSLDAETRILEFLSEQYEEFETNRLAGLSNGNILRRLGAKIYNFFKKVYHMTRSLFTDNIKDLDELNYRLSLGIGTTVAHPQMEDGTKLFSIAKLKDILDEGKPAGVSSAERLNDSLNHFVLAIDVWANETGKSRAEAFEPDNMQDIMRELMEVSPKFEPIVKAYTMMEDDFLFAAKTKLKTRNVVFKEMKKDADIKDEKGSATAIGRDSQSYLKAEENPNTRLSERVLDIFYNMERRGDQESSDSFGFKKSEDHFDVYNKFLKATHGSTSIEQMMSKLNPNDPEEQVPLLIRIAEALNGDVKLQAEFLRLAQKRRVNPVLVNISGDYVTAFNANSNGFEKLNVGLIRDYVDLVGIDNLPNEISGQQLFDFLNGAGIMVNRAQAEALGYLYIKKEKKGVSDTFNNRTVYNFVERMGRVIPDYYQSMYYANGKKKYAHRYTSHIYRELNRLIENKGDYVGRYAGDPLLKILHKWDIEVIANKTLYEVDSIKIDGLSSDYDQMSRKEYLLTGLALYFNFDYKEGARAIPTPVMGDGHTMIAVESTQSDFKSEYEEAVQALSAIFEQETVRMNDTKVSGSKNYNINKTKRLLIPQGTNEKGELLDINDSKTSTLSVEQDIALLVKNLRSEMEAFDIPADKYSDLQLKAFIAKTLQTQIITTLLYTGDPANFKPSKDGTISTDFFKRFKQVYSPGEYLAEEAMRVGDKSLVREHVETYNDTPGESDNPLLNVEIHGSLAELNETIGLGLGTKVSITSSNSVVNTSKSELGAVYDNNSSISKIGTKTQYLNYLNSVFPESELLYHSTLIDFDEFDQNKATMASKDMGKGLYVSDKNNVDRWSEYQDLSRSSIHFKLEAKWVRDASETILGRKLSQVKGSTDAPLFQNLKNTEEAKDITKGIGKVIEDLRKRFKEKADSFSTQKEAYKFMEEGIIAHYNIAPLTLPVISSRSTIKPVLTNTTNNLIVEDGYLGTENNNYSDYDSVFEKGSDGITQGVIPNPKENSLILGSKKDLLKFKDWVKGYKYYATVQDGQTWIDPFSSIVRLAGAGEIDMPQTKEEFMELIKDFNHVIYKPHYFGLHKKEDGLLEPVQKKDSEVVIDPKFAYHNPEMARVLRKFGWTIPDKSKGESIDGIDFDFEGRVAAKQTTAKTGFIDMYAPYSVFKIGLTEGRTIMSLSNWKAQLDTTPHIGMNQEQKLARQLVKLIDIDVPGLDKDKRRYIELLKQKTQELHKELKKIFNDPKELKKAILKQLDKYPLEIQEAFRDGTIDLKDPQVIKQVEPVLASLIRNKVSVQKVKGNSMFNVSAYGLSEENMPKVIIEKYDDSKPASKENIKKVIFEAWIPEGMHPALDKLQKDYFGERIPLDMIPDGFKEMLMYRIPTEDKYSMFVIRPIGIIPKNMSNGIIMPVEGPDISGFDYDIDKLFGFQYDVDKKGNKLETTNNEILDLMIKFKHATPIEGLNPGGFQQLTSFYETYQTLLDEANKRLNNTGIDVPRFLGVSAQIEALDNILEGLNNVGISANWNTGIPLVNVELKNPIITKSSKTKDATNSRSLKVEEDSKGNKASRNRAEPLAQAVDNAKFPLAAKLNLNNYTLPLYNLLVSTGKTVDEALLIINQPKFKEFVKKARTSDNIPLMIKNDFGVDLDSKIYEKAPYVFNLDTLDLIQSTKQNMESTFRLYMVAKEVAEVISVTKLADTGVGSTYAQTYLDFTKYLKFDQKLAENKFRHINVLDIKDWVLAKIRIGLVDGKRMLDGYLPYDAPFYTDNIAKIEELTHRPFNVKALTAIFARLQTVGAIKLKEAEDPTYFDNVIPELEAEYERLLENPKYSPFLQRITRTKVSREVNGQPESMMAFSLGNVDSDNASVIMSIWSEMLENPDTKKFSELVGKYQMMKSGFEILPGSFWSVMPLELRKEFGIVEDSLPDDFIAEELIMKYFTEYTLRVDEKIAEDGSVVLEGGHKAVPLEFIPEINARGYNPAKFIHVVEVTGVGAKRTTTKTLLKRESVTDSKTGTKVLYRKMNLNSRVTPFTNKGVQFPLHTSSDNIIYHEIFSDKKYVKQEEFNPDVSTADQENAVTIGVTKDHNVTHEQTELFKEPDDLDCTGPTTTLGAN